MAVPSRHYVGTIFALSSGAPPAGVAIIRISGPAVRFGIETLVGAVPPSRVATLRSLRNRDNLELDRGLVLFFPAPASFTGEDCAELHIHGGRAVVASVLETLATIEGFRHAEAGEFTRRAFENGRLDLTEVEGLADLIAAQTEMQRRLALEQARGNATALYDGWAKRLTHERAFIEAGLDFSDEGDVPEDVSGDVRERLAALQDEMARHLARGRAGEIVREGFRVVIAGPPNAGKSTLMNALAQRNVSIVSHEPGTTRDIVSVSLDLDGYVVILKDTAGLRQTEGHVEREGIRRAREAMDAADLVLYLVDLNGSVAMEHDALPDGKRLLVGTKADLAGLENGPVVDVRISAQAGTGLDRLLSILGVRVAAAAALTNEAAPARLRHRARIEESLASIAAVVANPDLPSELAAEELRDAAQSLGLITGRVAADDLLDVIFSSFCIGK